MNTLNYNDQEKAVLTAALTEFRVLLGKPEPVSMGDGMPTHYPPTFKATIIVAEICDGLLDKMEASATITVCSRDGEERLPFHAVGVIHGSALTEQQSREFKRNIKSTAGCVGYVAQFEEDKQPAAAKPEAADTKIQFSDEPVRATARKYPPKETRERVAVDTSTPEERL
ncbi:hypothetical protein [Fibrella forsythiae]|uniref:Single-stranded DNA-binding protein n=1 Tax=Fibrella forsythiae TaxID=2817061 RepID=A0ABS3JC14_9BACT|nr:hypothetical protein [Fibrella forsythiae]MBO0947532.1 hypothetical protein [Fibrella forsythiae]